MGKKIGTDIDIDKEFDDNSIFTKNSDETWLKKQEAAGKVVKVTVQSTGSVPDITSEQAFSTQNKTNNALIEKTSVKTLNVAPAAKAAAAASYTDGASGTFNKEEYSKNNTTSYTTNKATAAAPYTNGASGTFNREEYAKNNDVTYKFKPGSYDVSGKYNAPKKNTYEFESGSYGAKGMNGTGKYNLSTEEYSIGSKSTSNNLQSGNETTTVINEPAIEKITKNDEYSYSPRKNKTETVNSYAIEPEIKGTDSVTIMDNGQNEPDYVPYFNQPAKTMKDVASGLGLPTEIEEKDKVKASGSKQQSNKASAKGGGGEKATITRTTTSGNNNIIAQPTKTTMQVLQTADDNAIEIDEIGWTPKYNSMSLCISENVDKNARIYDSVYTKNNNGKFVLKQQGAVEYGDVKDALVDPTGKLIKSSMVYCRIIPGVLYFSEGMSKFYILDAWSGPIGYGTSESIKPYLDILHNYNYKFKNESAVNPGLKIRGYLDGGITENFTNEYADSALGGMANIFGDKISDISQMTGSVYGTDLLNRAKNFIEPFITAAGNGVENLIGKGLTDRIGGMMGAGAEALKGFAGNLQSAIQNSAPGVYNAGHMALDVLNAAAGGQRFDFPAVWKASVFQPNYSILVRLVNEDPTNDLAYQTNIVGPLTALLLLALPQVRTEFSSSHSWPFFCKVDAPGLFSLPAAGISNITVTKGESADTISFNQRPLIIDVRIEFVNLFSILPMGLTGDTRERRLTLDRYIENMMGWNTYQSNVDKTNGKFTVESGLSNFKSGDIDEVRQFIHPGNESIDLAWSNEKLVLTQALQIQEKQKEEANKKWYDKIADAWKAAGSDWVGRQKEFMEGVGGSYDNMLDTIQTGTVANATGTEKQEKKMQGADTNSAVVSPDPDSSD